MELPMPCPRLPRATTIMHTIIAIGDNIIMNILIEGPKY